MNAGKVELIAWRLVAGLAVIVLVMVWLSDNRAAKSHESKAKFTSWRGDFESYGEVKVEGRDGPTETFSVVRRWSRMKFDVLDWVDDFLALPTCEEIPGPVSGYPAVDRVIIITPQYVNASPMRLYAGAMLYLPDGKCFKVSTAYDAEDAFNRLLSIISLARDEIKVTVGPDPFGNQVDETANRSK